jgi:hypothetical protein
MARGSGMKGIGSKRSSSLTGKSKLISTKSFPQSFRPTGHMFGKQSVKPAKAR